MIGAREINFGPWAADLQDDERRARLRAFRALALVFARQHEAFIEALRSAETEPPALTRAADLFNHLPTLHQRRLIAAYAALARARR